MIFTLGLLLGLIIGIVIDGLLGVLRNRKIPTFPQIPIAISMKLESEELKVPVSVDVNRSVQTGKVELDQNELPQIPTPTFAHVVTHNGIIEYHGPDEAHAIRVQEQLEARGTGEVIRYVK